MTLLATDRLGLAFRDTAASYKFFWLLAVLDLLPTLDHAVNVRTIVKTMTIRAWPVVAFYRLSLGPVDRLQACVLDLQRSSGLDGRASPAQVGAAIDRWDAFAHWARELSRFVPGRFLGPWYPELARERPYDRRGARDVALASNNACQGEVAGPYRLFSRAGDDMLELAPGWKDWLSTHLTIVQGFVEQELCQYLQARNPAVPGIIAKLREPRRRNLASARSFWTKVIGRAEAEQRPIVDIYSGQPLGQSIEIDHFLPWAFVAHDELWNLLPVTPETNRSKRDHVPDLDLYLGRLAGLHFRALAVAESDGTLPSAYLDFFGCDKGDLVAKTEEEVSRRFDEIFRPLGQIAITQGFRGGWRHRG